MKFYLSSFKTGSEVEKLKKITQNGNKRVVYISNALDYLTDLEERKRYEGNDISDLKQLGFLVELLDLRYYFNKQIELEERIREYDLIWISGGNSFVLLQAMKLSGFDVIIKKYYEEKVDIVYGGFSAGVCVLGPTLKGIHLVDDQTEKPYGEQHAVIWDGLGILDYVIVPHYKSDHFESEEMDEVIQYLIDNKMFFIALRDGEVIVIE
ncbi:MAG: hypothetical protein CVU84_17500 [Firmicutes bacterium HGW-Firmicutes-1]|jgi:dipeptidase E|nr:MAG: hypothetical protein CVU84_17500 [Firmicutes bacterium HGW-Firmicutes-1]